MGGTGGERTTPAPVGWRGWTVLGAGAVAVRVAYWLSGPDPTGLRSDAAQYHEIATNLAAGDGFSSVFPQLAVHATAFRPPVYPALLAGLYRVTGPSIVAGKLLNLVIGVAVVLLVTHLVRREVGPTAGWIAGGLVAVYPPLVANDVNLLTEPVSLLLLVVIALELTGRTRWWLLGIETGLLVLTRPSAQLFVVVVAVFVLRAIGAKRAAGFVAVVVLVLVPWVVRNHAQVGTWNLYTSNGFNLAAMYSEPSQADRAFVDPVFDRRFGDHRLAQFDEALWDDEMRGIGLDGIRRNPKYVAFNVGRNTVATFELWPSINDAAERLDDRNPTVRLVGLPLFYVVTVLGVWGIVRSRRTTVVAFLGASGAYFVLVSLFLVAPPRLRAPFDLACCVGAAALLAPWWDRRRARRGRAQRADALAVDDAVDAPVDAVPLST